MFNDLLAWDFMLNKCDMGVEQVLVGRDNGMGDLDAAVWQTAFLAADLRPVTGRGRIKRGLNLSFLKVRTLLPLSVNGITRFVGYDICFFNETGNQKGLVTVHGYLPRPTVNNVGTLGLALCCTLGAGWMAWTWQGFFFSFGFDVFGFSVYFFLLRRFDNGGWGPSLGSAGMASTMYSTLVSFKLS